MDGAAAVAFLVGIVVAFFISVIGTKKLGQKVFNETGYNGFKAGHKFLGFLAIIPILLFATAGMMISEGESDFVALSIIGGIVVLALVVFVLVMLNRKAKKAGYIVGLTIFQILYGISFPLFAVLKFTLVIVMHMDIGGMKVQIDESQRRVEAQYAQTAANAEADRQLANQRAEAYAHGAGFDSADEAEDAGFNTGKRNPYDK